jgi:hypothetical protein
VQTGNYQRLSAVVDGVVWLDRPSAGELGDSPASTESERAKPALIRYDLAERKQSTAVDSLDSYQVSGDGARIAYRTAGLGGRSRPAVGDRGPAGPGGARVHPGRRPTGPLTHPGPADLLGERGLMWVVVVR